ncbi:MAG TPA: hypothetical protein VH741_10575 [Candidatus Limnocylindrales bacterium]
MALRALPPGAVRKRTAFGLFDADGWTWATIKATFWFLLIIFMLGYLPDRAYYFTVQPTLDLGYNVISPINWCSERNDGLPCPAPAGAITPWAPSPAELSLPAPRTGGAAFAAAENLYLAGGRTADGVTASVLANVVNEQGNINAWSEGAALDQPRADGVAVVASGTPFYIGGVDGSGAPSTSVLRGVLTEGALSGWEAVEELALPVAVTDAMAVATTRGLYLFGGRVDGTPSQQVWLAEANEQGDLAAWSELTELRLPEARANGTAAMVGNFVYLLGGEGADGAATNSVFFLALDNDGVPVVDDQTGRPQGWGVSVGQAAAFALPEARARHMSVVNSGAIYVIGGVGADGALAATTYWAVPSTVDGTIPAWNRLDVSDLPEGRADSGAVAAASHVFLIGGETVGGGSTASIERANLAPALPFFRLGLFGVTVPALGIPGEIGQQLGYLAAGGVALGNLVILILIGVAFSHQAGTLRLIERLSRGRFRAPREEEAV